MPEGFRDELDGDFGFRTKAYVCYSDPTSCVEE
jgi:hypothetical protein